MHDGPVGLALDYAREQAPRDVRDCLDWLVEGEFALAGERGGPDESAANVQLTFERSQLTVQITRDRGQWMMNIDPGHGKFVPLHILLTAWDGTVPAIRARNPVEQLPEVLPEGVAWRTVAPAIIAWLESGNRDREIGEAGAAWTRAWKKR